MEHGQFYICVEEQPTDIYLEINSSFKEKTSAPGLATCVKIRISPWFLYILLLHCTSVSANTMSNSQARGQDFDLEGGGVQAMPPPFPSYVPANSAVSL